MKYRCKPIEVTAYKITSVEETGVVLSNGEAREYIDGMVSRYQPQVGDYWVEAPNPGGEIYHYLNPKSVFESKYEAINV